MEWGSPSRGPIRERNTLEGIGGERSVGFCIAPLPLQLSFRECLAGGLWRYGGDAMIPSDGLLSTLNRPIADWVTIAELGRKIRSRMTKTRREVLVAMGAAVVVACGKRPSDSSRIENYGQAEPSRSIGPYRQSWFNAEMPSRVLFPREGLYAPSSVALTGLEMRGPIAVLFFSNGKSLEIDALLSSSDLLEKNSPRMVTSEQVVLKRIVAFTLDAVGRAVRARIGERGAHLREDFVALQSQTVLGSASLADVHGLLLELNRVQSVDQVRWEPSSNEFVVE